MIAAAVRKADANDLASVREIVLRAYSPYVERIGRSPVPMTARYDALVAEGLVQVIEVNGRVAGLLVLREEPSYILIENVAVDPALQGGGLGRRLLEHAEHHAIAVGIAEVRLYTHELMHENLAAYTKMGWEEYGRSVQDGFRRVFMRKPLSLTRSDDTRNRP